MQHAILCTACIPNHVADHELPDHFTYHVTHCVTYHEPNHVPHHDIWLGTP